MTDGPGPPALTPGQFVQSLERGLAVIRSFDAANPEMTLSDVAARSALSRATARRFLLTLVELGYVRTDGKRFALTARVLELGYAYLSSLTLPEIAQPHLETLSATVHESSSASVLDGTDVVYVARVPVKRIMTVSITLGTRLPAFATAMGRAILGHLDDAKRERTLERVVLRPFTERTIVSMPALRAELERVRRQGWAVVDQELELGLRSLAVPIRDSAGHPLAAINVTGVADTLGAEALPAPDVAAQRMVRVCLPHLLDAAAAIERDLRAAVALSP
jgi:IclR family pca regulon transcriptional regulator